MCSARCGNIKSAVFVITSLTALVSGAICSQLFTQPVQAAAPHPCFENPFPWGCQGRTCENSPESQTASCCWQDNASGGQYVCQVCSVDDNGDFVDCSEPQPQSSGGMPNAGIIAPPPLGVAPPPPTETCPENAARDAQGNCTPVTQTPEAPVTKSGLGNLLPEGIFGGPTTTPQQGEMNPEVAPLTGPEDESKTQERINTSPTGYCVPFRTPTCIPCDPGLPGNTCIPESEWPPVREEDTGTGTPEGKPKSLIPPITTEEAPQAGPPPTCLAGQELDKGTNLCVPVSQEQEEQPSDGSGGESGDDNDQQQQSDDEGGGSD